MKSKKSRNPASEHYSWELGTPDNATRTEVIVDPYKSSPSSDYVYEDDWNQDYPEDVRQLKPKRDTEHAQEYYGSGIDPYKNSFSVDIDDKKVLLPTKNIRGEDIPEDEAIGKYLDSGVSLGATQIKPLYDEKIKSLYEQKLRKLIGDPSP